MPIPPGRGTPVKDINHKHAGGTGRFLRRVEEHGYTANYDVNCPSVQLGLDAFPLVHAINNA